MLEHVFKALNDALATEKMRTQWEREKREEAEAKARETSKALEAVNAELAKLHHEHMELQERYRELKQGLEDY